MLYYVRQCYTMLDNVRQCYTMLYYVRQCYTMLYYVRQCYTMLYYVRQCYSTYTMLYYVRQCYTMLYYVRQCYTMLYYVILCLFSARSHRVGTLQISIIIYYFCLCQSTLQHTHMPHISKNKPTAFGNSQKWLKHNISWCCLQPIHSSISKKQGNEI